MPTLRSVVPLGLLLLAIAAFYVLLLNPGTIWADDWGLYLAHARNLATGRAYGDTGYIFNPLNPKLGPRTYPPLFPLLLSPAYAAFGLSLRAFKIENCLILLVVLGSTYALFRKYLGQATTLLLVALIACNPWFWAFRNFVYADWLCMLFVYLALLRADRGIDSLGRAATAGLCCYLAFATRTAGAAAAIAILGHALLRPGRTSLRMALAIALAFALAVVIQSAFLRNPVGYYLDNSQTASTAVDYGRGRILSAMRLLVYPFYDFFRFPGRFLNASRVVGFTLFAGALAALGTYYRTRIRKRDLRVFDVYLPVHVATFPFGYNWQRNFFPLAPILFFQVFTAIEEWAAARNWAPARRKTLAGAFVALLLMGYLLFHSAPSNRALPLDAQNVEGADAAELFAFVRAQTPADARIVFRRPRALTVFTDRAAAVYPEGPFGPHFVTYLRSIEARYLIAGNVFQDEPPELMGMAERDPAAFRQVFRNGSFRVFQFAPH